MLPNEELFYQTNQIYTNNIKYLLINKLILIYKYKLYYITTLVCIWISAPLSIRRVMADVWPLTAAKWRAVQPPSSNIYRNNLKYLLINKLILIYIYKLYYITIVCLFISAPLSIKRDMADVWPLYAASWRAV